MVSNFIFLGNKDERSFDVYISNVKIKNSNERTLLGIEIDKNLTFKKHIRELCRGVSYKLIVQNHEIFNPWECKLLANAFLNSQFNCAPLI